MFREQQSFCTMFVLPLSLSATLVLDRVSRFTGNIFNTGYYFGADANTPFLEFHTASTQSSRGTMCDTSWLRAPQLLTLAYIKELLLCRGRAQPSSEVLLDSVWEALRGWSTKVQTLNRLNNFWQSSVLVQFAAGLCLTTQAQMLGCYPQVFPPLSSLDLRLWFYAKGGQSDGRMESISTWQKK